jgi:hypothetical protein
MPRSFDKAKRDYKRDYIRGWESASRRPYPYDDVPPANSRKHSGPMLKLRKLWERDRLGVLGVGSAVMAFVLWALPLKKGGWIDFVELDFWETLEGSNLSGESPRYMLYWFTDARLPAIAAFLALALILLLLRRR